MDIEFKEGVVCFAAGTQWGSDNDFSDALNCKDFQLNTIKQGDFIAASELDNQKYNDAVEVFGLFGFNPYERKAKDALRLVNEIFFASDDLLFIGASEDCAEAERKITYNQLMAIGELKRLEIKRDKAVNVPPNHFIPKAGEYAVSDKEFEKSAPKIAPELTPDLVNNQEVKMQKNKPVVAQVMIDLTERMEIGIKTYGEALRANNGRDSLQDAYEEALDLACYLKQAMIEKEIANYEKDLKGNGG